MIMSFSSDIECLSGPASAIVGLGFHGCDQRRLQLGRISSRLRSATTSTKSQVLARIPFHDADGIACIEYYVSSYGRFLQFKKFIYGKKSAVKNQLTISKYQFKCFITLCEDADEKSKWGYDQTREKLLEAAARSLRRKGFRECNHRRDMPCGGCQHRRHQLPFRQ
jgi:hypothetical protein